MTPLAPAQTPAGAPEIPSTPGPAEPKHLSSHIASALREKLPAFNPLAKKDEPAPEKANSTVVLEKMVILGAKPLSFTERELLNKSGLAALLRKLYPGASVPPDSHLPNYASLILADDERLTHMEELHSVAEMLKTVGDIQAGKDLENEIARAFIRGHDWQTESMDRSANNNRR